MGRDISPSYCVGTRFGTERGTDAFLDFFFDLTFVGGLLVLDQASGYRSWNASMSSGMSSSIMSAGSHLSFSGPYPSQRMKYSSRRFLYRESSISETFQYSSPSSISLLEQSRFTLIAGLGLHIARSTTLLSLPALICACLDAISHPSRTLTLQTRPFSPRHGEPTPREVRLMKQWAGRCSLCDYAKQGSAESQW